MRCFWRIVSDATPAFQVEGRHFLKMISADSFDQLVSLHAIHSGTLHDKQFWPAYHTHSRLNVSFIEPPFCAAHIQVATFRICCMRMDFAMTGINHGPFVIRFVNQNFKQLLPDSRIVPADKSTMGAAPIITTRWQITPWWPVCIIQRHW